MIDNYKWNTSLTKEKGSKQDRWKKRNDGGQMTPGNTFYILSGILIYRKES